MRSAGSFAATLEWTAQPARPILRCHARTFRACPPQVAARLRQEPLTVATFPAERREAVWVKGKTSPLLACLVTAGAPSICLRSLGAEEASETETFRQLHERCLQQLLHLRTQPDGPQSSALYICPARARPGDTGAGERVFYGFAVPPGLPELVAGWLDTNRPPLVLAPLGTLMDAYTLPQLAMRIAQATEHRFATSKALQDLPQDATAAREKAALEGRVAKRTLDGLLRDQTNLQHFMNRDAVLEAGAEKRPVWHRVRLEDGSEALRPVVSTEDGAVLFTRVHALETDTSIVMRPRHDWELMRSVLMEAVQGHTRWELYICSRGGERKEVAELWSLLQASPGQVERAELPPDRLIMVEEAAKKSLLACFGLRCNAPYQLPLVLAIDSAPGAWDTASAGNVLQVKRCQPHRDAAVSLLSHHAETSASCGEAARAGLSMQWLRLDALDNVFQSRRQPLDVIMNAEADPEAFWAAMHLLGQPLQGVAEMLQAGRRWCFRAPAVEIILASQLAADLARDSSVLLDPVQDSQGGRSAEAAGWTARPAQVTAASTSAASGGGDASGSTAAVPPTRPTGAVAAAQLAASIEETKAATEHLAASRDKKDDLAENVAASADTINAGIEAQADPKAAHHRLTFAAGGEEFADTLLALGYNVPREVVEAVRAEAQVYQPTPGVTTFSVYWLGASATVRLLQAAGYVIPEPLVAAAAGQGQFGEDSQGRYFCYANFHPRHNSIQKRPAGILFICNSCHSERR